MSDNIGLSQDIRNLHQHTNRISRNGLSSFPPVIITCVLNAEHFSKEDNPNFPETVEELAKQGIEACRAGAAILRIGGGLSEEACSTLYALLRRECPEVILSAAVGGSRRIDPLGEGKYTTSAPRTALLATGPEMATVDISCYASDRDDSIRFMAHRDLEAVVAAVREAGIKPCFEMTKTTDIKYLTYLQRKGLLDAPYWCDLQFGGLGVDPILDEVLTAIQDLPDNGTLSLKGAGCTQRAVTAHAIVMGLHVCVGMGNSVYYIPEEEQLAENNAQLVARVVRLAAELARPVATPAQAREMLGLPAPKEY